MKELFFNYYIYIKNAITELIIALIINKIQ